MNTVGIKLEEMLAFPVLCQACRHPTSNLHRFSKSAININRSIQQPSSELFYPASTSFVSDPQVPLYHTCPSMLGFSIYDDAKMSIELAKHPTAWGQAIAVFRPAAEGIDLFSRDVNDYSDVMQTVSNVATALRRSCAVKRCALVTEGRDSISIIPLHGLSQEWSPITSGGPHVFYEEYPGYISSKNGPRMDDSELGEICTRIQTVSGITRPYDLTSSSDQSNSNLFAMIVRGELQQWRVWENERHVAFLTPFPNTAGKLS